MVSGDKFTHKFSYILFNFYLISIEINKKVSKENCHVRQRTMGKNCGGENSVRRLWWRSAFEKCQTENRTD